MKADRLELSAMRWPEEDREQAWIEGNLARAREIVASYPYDREVEARLALPREEVVAGYRKWLERYRDIDGWSHRRELLRRYRSECPVPPWNVLFLNTDAATIFGAAVGHELAWVRSWAVDMCCPRRIIVPPKSWWQDPLTIALRVTEIAHDPHTAQFVRYEVQFFDLKSLHDLLEHKLRGPQPLYYRPREAVDWASVLVGPIVGLPNLPAFSPRELADEIVVEWLREGKKLRLPSETITSEERCVSRDGPPSA